MLCIAREMRQSLSTLVAHLLGLKSERRWCIYSFLGRVPVYKPSGYCAIFVAQFVERTPLKKHCNFGV